MTSQAITKMASEGYTRNSITEEFLFLSCAICELSTKLLHELCKRKYIYFEYVNLIVVCI